LYKKDFLESAHFHVVWFEPPGGIVSAGS
jgi:hypothetical protein